MAREYNTQAMINALSEPDTEDLLAMVSEMEEKLEAFFRERLGDEAVESNLISQTDLVDELSRPPLSFELLSGPDKKEKVVKNKVFDQDVLNVLRLTVYEFVRGEKQVGISVEGRVFGIRITEHRMRRIGEEYYFAEIDSGTIELEVRLRKRAGEKNTWDLWGVISKRTLFGTIGKRFKARVNI